MADLLQRGSDFLASRFKASVSQSVTYQSGELSLALKATLGTRLLQQETTNGTQLVSTSADWVVVAADLTDGAERFEPSIGDRIVATLSGQTVTHEVCDETGGGKCFEYDAYRKTVRVHTKVISVS